MFFALERLETRRGARLRAGVAEEPLLKPVLFRKRREGARERGRALQGGGLVGGLVRRDADGAVLRGHQEPRVLGLERLGAFEDGERVERVENLRDVPGRRRGEVAAKFPRGVVHGGRDDCRRAEAAHDGVEIVPSPRRGAAAPLASRAEGGCSRYGQQHEKRIADADVHAEHDAMRCLSPELLVFNDSDWLDAAVCKPWESSKVDFTAKDRRGLLQLDITSHPTFHAPHSEMPRASAGRRLSSLPPPSRKVTLRIDASKVRHLSTVTLVDDTKSAGGREIAALVLHLSSGLPMTEITTSLSKGLRQAVK